MQSTCKLLFLAFCAVIVMNTACSKDNDPATPDSNKESQWTIGSYTYAPGTSSQQYIAVPDYSGKVVAVGASTTGDGGDYGAFSGSAISFIFPNHLDVGTYTLTSSTGLKADLSQKRMVITCTIGFAVNDRSAFYTSTEDSGTAELTLDKDGKYHINIVKPVKLIKDEETDDDMPDAADSYLLTVQNVY